MNTLYTISPLQIEQSKVESSVCINPEHDLFKGHFPQKPVVPGVSMIQMISDMVRLYIGKPVALKSAAQIKFLNLWLPEVADQADIVMNIMEAHIDSIKLNAQISINGKPLFKIRANFGRVDYL